VPAHNKRSPDSPSGSSRWLKGPHRGRTITIAAVVIVLVGFSAGIFATSGTHKPKKKSHAKTVYQPKLAVNLCPLTDTPAPGGVVPRRPALLIKIGNEPPQDGNARPQSGLNEADIVFDTPAEGFIMRYVAVYQCNDASSIGPVRSVRWVDYHMIARMFYNPILAFAGGIDPNIEGVQANSSWLSAANLLDGAQGAGTRVSSRQEPDNLYTSTTALYALFKSKTSPPPSIFSYSASVPPGATPAASFGINFSYGTDVIWNWDATTKMWLHTYSGSPDVDTLTGQQVSTANIVVAIVDYRIGPYSESTGGTGDIESELEGSGPGYVLRDGTVVKVTWHRSDLVSGLTFTNAAGQRVDLAPGRTWVEIDPNTQADAPGGITIDK
jgi:hypothetical protein